MTSTQARSFWIEAPLQGRLRSEPLGPCGAGEVRVRTLHSAVSRGTELLVWRGRVPASEWQRMRAPFQAGEFPGPLKYGYCSVGLVEEGPAELLGREVFCLHPHQDVYVVPAAAVHPLPPGLPASRAVLAANIETAVNAVWDAGCLPGERIAVVGAGVVGLAIAWIAAGIRGCEVQVIDIDPARAAVAARLGAGFALPDQARTEADRVFHASATAQGLQTALRIAGFEATVIEASWYGDGPVGVELGGAFHARRLVLRSSQVGHVATAQRARWDHRRRLSLALSLARDEALEALITGHHDFERLPALMRSLHEGAPGLCERIDYS